MKTLLATTFSILSFLNPFPAKAADLNIGDDAPQFTAQTHEGKEFKLANRANSWTVLYFYPKAGTPGCTTQACAFRDNIQKIKSQGADVFGISADSVADQAAFYKKHNLNFTLLADPDDAIINMYHTKMPVLKMSKRWTFIVDPQLKIRAIEKDVDPALDAEHVAGMIAKFKAEDAGKSAKH